MNNTKCPHIVDMSKSRITVPHYYCRKTGKLAVIMLHQTLYCEECPYSNLNKLNESSKRTKR